jgi:hypothetical protein
MISSKKLGRMVTADVDKALANIDTSTPKPDMKADGAELKAAVAPKNDLSFAEAFKANRMANNKTFTWRGKSYSTKMAGEGASRPAATRRSAAETPKTAAKSGLKPETEKFLNNLRPAMYINRKDKAYISDKVTPNPKNKSDYIPVSSLKSKSDAKPAASAAKAEAKSPTNAGRSEGFLSRMFKGSGSSDFAKSQERKYGKRTPLLLVGEAAREANRKQGTIGGKAKGGKIDGAAIRGKTRAMKKGK